MVGRDELWIFIAVLSLQLFVNYQLVVLSCFIYQGDNFIKQKKYFFSTFKKKFNFSKKSQVVSVWV